MRPIALIGLSGSGKSTVAARVADRLSRRLVDLDARIESASGTSVAQVFAARGEAGFRALEAEALRAAMAEGAEVIACGGGVVLTDACRTLLERCRAVWLEVSPSVAADRLHAGAATRPLLAGTHPEASLERLLRERSHRYAEVAAARVATDGRTVDEVVDAVLRALAALEPDRNEDPV